MNIYKLKLQIGENVLANTEMVLEFMIGMQFQNVLFPPFQNNNFAAPNFFVRFMPKKIGNNLSLLKEIVSQWLDLLETLKPLNQEEECFKKVLKCLKISFFQEADCFGLNVVLQPFLNEFTSLFDKLILQKVGNAHFKLEANFNLNLNDLVANEQSLSLIEIIAKGLVLNVNVNMMDCYKEIIREKNNKEDSILLWLFLNQAEINLTFKNLEEFLKAFPKEKPNIKKILSEFKNIAIEEILKKIKQGFKNAEIKIFLEKFIQIFSKSDEEINFIVVWGKKALKASFRIRDFSLFLNYLVK